MIRSEISDRLLAFSDDSTVTFHFAPVVYTLGGPPIGSDDGGSEVYIRGFGLTDDMLASTIQCKFGDVGIVNAISVVNRMVTCISPPLPATIRGTTAGLKPVQVQLSVDNGGHFSSTATELNPCTCHGGGYVLDVAADDCHLPAVVGGAHSDRCWDTTTNTFEYHEPFLLTDLGTTKSAPLAGGVTLELQAPADILSTLYQAEVQPDGKTSLRCRFSPLGQTGAGAGVLYEDGTRLDNGRVECPVPTSAMPRDVQVELSLNAQQFTVSPQVRDGFDGDGLRFNFYDTAQPPQLRSSSPESGSKGGGTPIRIRGTNFANLATLTCRFIRPPEMCTAAAGSAPDHIKTACEGADISSNVVTTAQSNCLSAADGTAEGQARIAASGAAGTNCAADPRACINPSDTAVTASELCYYIEDYATDTIPDVTGNVPTSATPTGRVTFISTNEVECLAPAVSTIGGNSVIRDIHVVVSNDDGGLWSGTINTLDTARCTLTPTTDFGLTAGTCADVNSADATCVHIPGVFSTSMVIDTIDTPDSCTSTVVVRTLPADTTHCTRTGTANFGVTAGTCAEVDSAVATCTYVAGVYSDASGDGTMDTDVTADSCTATLLPVVTTTDTNLCTLTATADFGVVPGSCFIPLSAVDTPDSCTSTLVATVATNDVTVVEACTPVLGDAAAETAAATTCTLTAADAAATPAVVGACAVATGSGTCVYVALVGALCTLTSTTDFGVTDGYCMRSTTASPPSSSDTFATCLYVGGTYSDANSDGTMDTQVSPDSCTSTLVATVTLTDTNHCTMTGTTDLGLTDGSCADVDSTLATCAYVPGAFSTSAACAHVPGTFSASGILDVINTPDSCTSTLTSGAGFGDGMLFRYTDCHPRVSTVIGLGLFGSHIAGNIGTANVIANAVTGNDVSQMTTGGDSFYLEINPNPPIEIAEGVGAPEIDSKRVDSEDGTHTLSYNITIAGTYDIRVLLGGVPVQSQVSATGDRESRSGYLTAADLGGTAVNIGTNLAEDFAFNYGDGYFTYSVIIAPAASVGYKADASGPGYDGWYIWHMPVKGSFSVQARDVYGNALITGGETVVVRFDYVDDSNSTLPGYLSGEVPDTVLQKTIDDDNNGRYNVSYESQRAGLYVVHVEVGGDVISNSNHTLQIFPDVSIPLNSFGRTSCGDVGHECVAGDPLELSITSADEYSNAAVVGGAVYEVTFTVVGYIQSTPYQSAIQSALVITPTDNSDGSYTTLHSPTLSGDYTIEVKICADELGGVPEWIAYDDAGLQLRRGCRSIGRLGALNATVVATVPFGINSLAYGESRVIDTYNWYVLPNVLGHAQSGSAFNFEVEARDRFNNRINVGGHSVTGSLFQTAHNQRTAFMTKADRLNASATSPPPQPFPACTDTEDGECAVVGDNGDGTFDLSYRVTLSGIYKLKIEIEGQDLSVAGHIMGEDDLGLQWFILDVEAAAAFAPFCEIGSFDREGQMRSFPLLADHECTPKPDCLGQSMAGETMRMQIQAFDLFGNQRTTGGDYMTLVFRPIQKWNGDISAGAPALIYLDDSSVPAAPAFNPNIMKVDNNNGLYQLTYTLTKTGDYLIEVNINNVTFSESFPFNVGPASPYPGTSRADIDQLAAVSPIVAGFWTTFVITSYDRFENLVPYGGRNMTAEFEPLDSTNLLLVNFGSNEWDGGGTFDEQHYVPQGTAPVGSGYVTPFLTTDFLSGIYIMNYTFYVRSRLRINVYMDGVSIFGSPYHIGCDSGPLVINNCVAVNDVAHPTGLTNGIAGNAYFFRVWSRDLYGNRKAFGGQNFDATVAIDNTTASLVGRLANVDSSFEDVTLDDVLNRTTPLNILSVTDEADGSYLTYYTLTIAAQYDLTVSLNGSLIRGQVRIASVLFNPTHLLSHLSQLQCVD